MMPSELTLAQRSVLLAEVRVLQHIVDNSDNYVDYTTRPWGKHPVNKWGQECDIDAWDIAENILEDAQAKIRERLSRLRLF